MSNRWPTKTLGEVCQFRGGGTPSKSMARYWCGDIPWVSPKDMKFDIVSDSIDHISQEAIECSATSLIPKESVLMVVRSGILARTVPIAITGRDLTINQDLKALCPNKGVNARFLYHLLESKMDVLLSMVSRGATVHRLMTDEIRSLSFIVPPPSEQMRIVGILDEAFDGLATAKANAEKNHQNARALFESHLGSVFAQRGKGWVEKMLGEIGKVSMCKRIFKEETIATEGIPFYKIGTFGKEPDSFIPTRTYSEYRQKYPFPKKGDVLISASGTIGRRVRYDGEPAYFQDSNIVWIDNDEKQALNDYLYHFYAACEWNSTKGATISRLYNDNLRRIVIAFPESLHEQRRIVAQLDALAVETEHLKSIYQQKLAALDALKRSLLHQAFSGAL